MKRLPGYFIKASLFLLFPVSLIYFSALKLKERLYALSILKKRKLPATVISVGNITLGGTGKTPHVLYLASLLKGKSVAVLTRGYARKSSGKIIFSKEDFSPEALGDEPFLLASELSGAPVVVSKDRYSAGLAAIEKYSSEVLLLDDGFQRRISLSRDLDIVLVDSLNPFGNGLLFPAGILREPVRSLRAADIIILSKSDAADTARLEKRVKRINPGALVIKSVYAPEALVNIRSKEKAPGFEALSGKRVAVLSGVGNPEYFEMMVSALGAEKIVPIRFRDHHYYSVSDISKIDRLAAGCAFIVTTGKDAVKLVSPGVPGTELPALELRIGVKITSGEEELRERLGLK